MPRGKTHFVKGPCNNKQKVLQFPRFEGFISVEGGGLEGERKRLGWSLQNTPSSSPCLAKCCLQQFGPLHQPSFQSHHPPAPPQDLDYSSDVGHRRVSEAAPFPPRQGSVPKAPAEVCAEPPVCPSRSRPAWELQFQRRDTAAGRGRLPLMGSRYLRWDGALHPLWEAALAYLPCCVCLSDLLTALHFQAGG